MDVCVCDSDEFASGKKCLQMELWGLPLAVLCIPKSKSVPP
jgi:hypothetical protein